MIDFTNEQAMKTALDTVSRVMGFLARHRDSMAEGDIIIKADGSPVTTRDLAGQALYVLSLEAALDLAKGQLRLCAEETVEILHGASRKDLRRDITLLVNQAGYQLDERQVVDAIARGSLRPDSGLRSTHWICDPIDGTKRFISGHAYSTCLAFVRDGRLVAGSIGVPDLQSGDDSSEFGTLVGAFLGGGAFQMNPNSTNGSLKRLSISPDSIDASAIRVARSLGAESFGPSIRHRLQEAGLTGVPVQVDNQSKYAALVTGRIDLITQAGAGTENPCTWDFAPGVLLADEYGAKVNDASDRPFDFDTGPYLLHNRGVHCAHPELYDSFFGSS